VLKFTELFLHSVTNDKTRQLWCTGLTLFESHWPILIDISKALNYGKTLKKKSRKQQYYNDQEDQQQQQQQQQTNNGDQEEASSADVEEEASSESFDDDIKLIDSGEQFVVFTTKSMFKL